MSIGFVELFAGAAGLAHGFINAKDYIPLALSDIEPSAAATWRTKYPAIPYICKDALKLSADDIREEIGDSIITGLLGGPPCQGFSLNGKKNQNDSRNRFIFSYARFVRDIKPLFILMENVPQILFDKRFKVLLNYLEENYYVRYGVLNAAEYGVPQTRHRMFIIAYRKDLNVIPTLPAPTHAFINPVFGYRSKRMLSPNEPNAREEILGAGPVVSKFLPIAETEPPTQELKQFQTVGDTISSLIDSINDENVNNHFARVHSDKMLNLMRLIPEGGDLRDVDRSYWPKSHFSQAYGRLHRDGLARTITTCFYNAGSGRFTHYSENRTISVREAARLQGFDDDYIFRGTLQQQMTQVGNAVPTQLAKALAFHIKHQLGRAIDGT